MCFFGEPWDHLFNYPNTPIYIAARLIQLFGMSTPPASYMLAVGGAFSLVRMRVSVVRLLDA